MSEVNVSIGKDLIEPIIKSKVQAAIIEAVSNEQDLVTRFIAQTLETKCDKNGKVCYHDYENKYTMLEYMCIDTLRDCAKQAIRSWMEDNKKEIRKALTAQLKTTKTTSTFTKAILSGLTTSIKSDWRMDVKVELNTLKD